MASIDLRDILATNLRRIINADTSLGAKPSVRAWALGRKLDVRMIDRLVKGEHAITLDKLAEVADACGLKPWHLLLPELEPNSTPESPITEEERKMLKRLRKLLGD